MNDGCRPGQRGAAGSSLAEGGRFTGGGFKARSASSFGGTIAALAVKPGTGGVVGPISTGSVRKLVPSEKRVVPVTGLVRAVLPSVKVVVPVTVLVRPVEPLSQTVMPIERLVRQVCAAAPPASSMEAHNAETDRALITPHSSAIGRRNR